MEEPYIEGVATLTIVLNTRSSCLRDKRVFTT